MTREIELTRGKVAIVDDADYEWLSQWKWYARKSGSTFYAGRKAPRKGGKQTEIHMHREILRPPDGMEADHVNGNGLDNRRSNLRTCTRVENMRNTGSYSSNTSGCKGVHWDKRHGKWRARIGVNGKPKHLGYYTDKDEAAQAYSEAALRLFGGYARINP